MPSNPPKKEKNILIEKIIWVFPSISPMRAVGAIFSDLFLTITT